MNELLGIKIGYALCGSFCTFKKSFETLKKLIDMGADVTPIMSYNAYSIDSRFGTADENHVILETLCDKKIIHSIEAAEPIGPKRMFDIIVVAPCTGNTLAKLATGIIDTPVTMAVRSHIRNSRPVLLCIATNDALSGSAKNIGMLLNCKNYFFVPMVQDNPKEKPTSIVADFDKIPDSILSCLSGHQPQPIIF